MCKRGGGPHPGFLVCVACGPTPCEEPPLGLCPLSLTCSREGPQQGGQGQCETACRPSALPAGPVAPIDGGAGARPGAASPACHSGGVGPGGDALGLALPEGAPALSQRGPRQGDCIILMRLLSL